MVAFDLEEFGSQGALVFLHDFLLPKVLRPRGFPQTQFTGAIVMDSILNFNSSVGSQDVEEEWKTLMPELAASLKKQKGKGDFLAVFNRDVPSDETLRAVFQKMWEKNKGAEKGFGLEDFKMAGLSKKPNLTQLADHVNLLRSD